jgi:hypothetical protein
MQLRSRVSMFPAPFLRTPLALAATALCVAASHAQTTLNASAGPANNGGSANWAIFFDLTAGTNDLVIREMTTASTATAGAAYTVEILTFVGSGLGGPVASGPGSSSTGWTSLGTAPATQGAVSSQVSLPIDIPDIAVAAGTTVGVAVRFTGAGPRYLTSSGAYTVFADADLSLTTGDSRSAPFTAGGSWFAPRVLVGSVTYDIVPSGPVIYCTSGTSTNGCVPAIGSIGTPSASASSGFTLTATGVEGQKQGLFFYGINGQIATPWGVGGASTLCVKAPTQRMTIQNSGGTVGLCDGSYAEDWLAFIAANPTALGAPFSAGNVVNSQGWYRDPPSVKTTNLTDAIEFTIVP